MSMYDITEKNYPRCTELLNLIFVKPDHGAGLHWLLISLIWASMFTSKSLIVLVMVNQSGNQFKNFIISTKVCWTESDKESLNT